jgi:hypothetical protein
MYGEYEALTAIYGGNPTNGNLSMTIIALLSGLRLIATQYILSLYLEPKKVVLNSLIIGSIFVVLVVLSLKAVNLL